MITTETTIGMISFHINGAWERPEGRAMHPVTCPANGATIAEVPYAVEADVDRAVRAAHTAFLKWRDVPVVFPKADHKFFLVASLDEKVRRRAAQYERRGERVDEEVMRKEVEERDRVDTQRAVAPLRPAPDAVVIDTDHLDVDQVVDAILKHVTS